MDDLSSVVIGARINQNKQGFKMSGDGSASMVLELDAVSAIKYAIFYANACKDPGNALKVTIDLLE